MHEDAQTALETAARRYDHSADELEAAANHLRTAARWFRERHVPVAAPTPSPRTATCAPRKSPSTRTPSSTLLSRSPNRREARYPQRSGDWRAIESSPRGRAQERVRHGMSVARPTPRGWSQRRSRLSRGRVLGAADRPGNWTRQTTAPPPPPRRDALHAVQPAHPVQAAPWADAPARLDALHSRSAMLTSTAA